MSALAEKLLRLRRQSGGRVDAGSIASPPRRETGVEIKMDPGSTEVRRLRGGSSGRDDGEGGVSLRSGYAGTGNGDTDAIGGGGGDGSTSTSNSGSGSGSGSGSTIVAGSGSEAIDALRRLLGVRARDPRTAMRPTGPVDRRVVGEEIAPGLRYVEVRGMWPKAPVVVDAAFAKLDAIDARRFCFFDTETTGLAGGTGTRAFMIGAADWCGSEFRLRQLTITTLGAEAAMLREFATWIDEDAVLVSYNGKCYDAPLLATRYRLARMANPLAGRAHLDLLHPVRRRYRGVWENCRMATIEHRALGVVREDDLPGSEAPRAWLDYLRGGSAVNLRRVAEHNAQDLRSLAGLLLHMAALGVAETSA